MEVNKILQGDCLERLKELPDNSVDSIVTDPPYGLSFMGKKWDYDVPSVEVWKECLRVLKPGGHLLCFAGSRTYHRMAINIEDAGFEIRDQIMWIYGSGFPKSMNIGKAVDKLQGNEREKIGTKYELLNQGSKPGTFGDRHEGYQRPWQKNPESDAYFITKGNTEWEGWGTALKPAHEPIVVARKPITEKNIALNVLKYGAGGINIDECRIGTNGGTKRSHQESYGDEGRMDQGGLKPWRTGHIINEINKGRFPANVILECTCDKTEEGDIIGNGHFNSKVSMEGKTLYEGGFKDFEQKDRVLKEKAIIHTNPDCPCFIMDSQSGESKSKKQLMGTGIENIKEASIYGKYMDIQSVRGHNDKGGASRFFYCAKASKSERNNGCEHMPLKHYLKENKMGGEGDTMLTGSGNPRDCRKHNNHPTVKPIKLMEYLVRLVTPSSGIVLDPFIGSGTTAISCIKQDFKFIGIEKETEYIEIANARLKHYQGDHNE